MTAINRPTSTGALEGNLKAFRILRPERRFFFILTCASAHSGAGSRHRTVANNIIWVYRRQPAGSRHRTVANNIIWVYRRQQSDSLGGPTPQDGWSPSCPSTYLIVYAKNE